MSVLQKLRRKLPAIPPQVDEHPDLVRHRDQIAALETRRDATRREVTSLEAERQRLAQAVSEDQVLDLLGEDTGAVARIAAGTERLREIDTCLTQLRERALIEDEAVRRLQAREPQIRAAVSQAVRHEVEQVHRELTTLLAERLEALVPINCELLALKRQHWDAVPDLVAFEDLDPVPRGGNPNRLELWLRQARSLGVHVKGIDGPR